MSDPKEYLVKTKEQCDAEHAAAKAKLEARKAGERPFFKNVTVSPSGTVPFPAIPDVTTK